MENKLVSASCERASDLIAFLYGEANDTEVRDIKDHLQQCSACSSEFVAFQQVRKSLDAWKQASLGVFSPVHVGGHEDITAARVVERQRRSALAALQQFFSLSPLWMKAAVAFASVLFCLSAVLAISYLRQTSTSVAAIPANPLTPHPDIQAIIDKEVAKRLQDFEKGRAQQNTAVAVNVPERNRELKAAAGHRSGLSQVAYSRDQKTRRPLTQLERQQLAADLRLVSPREDAELDLVGDKLNRQD